MERNRMNRLFYDKIINMRKKNASKGLTFLEMLVVVGILVVLVAAVIFAVQPGERLAKSRDNQREVHLNTIWHAVKQKAHMEGGWENCDPLPETPTFIGSDNVTEYNLYSCIYPDFLANHLFDPKTGHFNSLENYYTGYQIWQNPTTKVISLQVDGETRLIYIGESFDEGSGLPVTDNLALHLDTDAIKRLNNGDSVAQRDDLSAEDNHAEQATSNYQQIKNIGIYGK